VPDRVLQTADDVILVDITPDELIQRLKEGKVYVPETARRATQNFFTPGNLTALRELALRRTAERVDDQMVDYLRQHAIEGPWATSERLLVCVEPDISSQLVVRAAARLASGLNAAWIALYVERPGEEVQDAERLKVVDDALRLAERLGGEVERLSAHDLAGEVLRYAPQENITQIVVGRSRAGRLARQLRRSLTEEIVRRSRDIAVQVVMDDQAPSVGERRPRFTLRRRWMRGVFYCLFLMRANFASPPHGRRSIGWMRRRLAPRAGLSKRPNLRGGGPELCLVYAFSFARSRRPAAWWALPDWSRNTPRSRSRRRTNAR
jgi:two-component system sensor histidine kinase KdpD